MITIIGERQGFGDLLAEGMARTIKVLGEEYNQVYTGPDPLIPENSSKMSAFRIAGWGYQSREFLLEQPYPVYLVEALQWMIDARDPNPGKWLDFGSDEMLDYMFEFDQYASDVGTKMPYENAIRGAIIDSLLVSWMYPQRTGMGWYFPERRGVDPEHTNCESQYYSAVTGIETSEEELY